MFPARPLAIAACSRLKPSGSIVISRIAPALAAPAPESAPLLGFLPGGATHNRNWILVDRSAGTLSVMAGQLGVSSFEAHGLDKIPAGRYQVLHKQARPLWYANDAYFTARGLPVPPEGSSERYLKGALGEAALYLDRDTPIYSSAFASDEVGGIRLSASDLEAVFSAVEVGAAIELR